MITLHCLERYLPSTGLILDTGSGPGRYAIDLAQQGYRVVMFDLVHEMLQFWYNFATGELEDLAQRTGLQVVDRVGCEGLAAHLPIQRLEQLEADPKRWPVWREILLETCNDPTIIGVSNHLLVVPPKSSLGKPMSARSP